MSHVHIIHCHMLARAFSDEGLLAVINRAILSATAHELKLEDIRAWSEAMHDGLTQFSVARLSLCDLLACDLQNEDLLEALRAFPLDQVDDEVEFLRRHDSNNDTDRHLRQAATVTVEFVAGLLVFADSGVTDWASEYAESVICTTEGTRRPRTKDLRRYRSHYLVVQCPALQVVSHTIEESVAWLEPLLTRVYDFREALTELNTSEAMCRDKVARAERWSVRLERRHMAALAEAALARSELERREAARVRSGSLQLSRSWAWKHAQRRTPILRRKSLNEVWVVI